MPQDKQMKEKVLKAIKSELIALSKNRKEKSSVVAITRDGWVMTENGTMGDNQEDCVIKWEWDVNGGYIKNLRIEKGLTQQEMAWILGISRPTYIFLEQGKRELTHKEYLITKIINENL